MSREKIHIKTFVERDSTFDNGTRGRVAFGVDDKDKTQPFRIGPLGTPQGEDFLLFDLLQNIIKRQDIIIHHLEIMTSQSITKEDLNDA